MKRIRWLKIGLVSTLTLLSFMARASMRCITVNLDSVGHVSLYKNRIESFARGPSSPDYAIYLVIKGFASAKPEVVERVILMSNAAKHSSIPVCSKKYNRSNENGITCLSSLADTDMLVIVNYKQSLMYDYRALSEETKDIALDIGNSVLNCK